MSTEMRTAWRGLRRSPGLSLSIALLLGVGVGATMLATTLTRRLVLQSPSHVADPEYTGRIFFTFPLEGRRSSTVATTPYSFLRFAQSIPIRSAEIAGFFDRELPVMDASRGRFARTVLCSGSYWTTIGVRPALGRFFSEAEADPNAGSRVVVLSHQFWTQEYAGSPAVLGASVLVKNVPYVIIGVAPAGFRGTGQLDVDIWLPFFANADQEPNRRRWTESSTIVELVARHNGGVARERVEAELSQLMHSYLEGRGDVGAPPSTRLIPLRGDVGPDMQLTGTARVSLWMSAVSVALLLLAMLNVSALLAVRASRRRLEIAMRSALGMSRGRLARLFLVEGGMLALAGGLLGWLLTYWGHEAVLAWLHVESASYGWGTDWPTLALVCATIMLGTVIFALAPLIQIPRNLSEVLKGVSSVGGGAGLRMRRAVVCLQVAASTVLVVGAGLFVTSLRNARRLELGLRPEGVWAIQGAFAGTGRSGDEIGDYYRQALDQIRRLPGISHVSLAEIAPLRGALAGELTVPGRKDLPRDPSMGAASVSNVTADYFATVGTRIVAGRGFTPEDERGAPVVVVSEAMARAYWAGASPLGTCVGVGDSTCAVVVGIAEDSRRFFLREPPGFHYYRPLTIGSREARVLLVRPGRGGETVIANLPPLLRNLPGAPPLVRMTELDQVLEPQYRSWRMGAMALSFCALVAGLLACIGAYGVAAASVASRTREIGVRIALGAGRREILRVVIGRDLAFVIGGILVGILVAAVSARGVAALLFDVSPWSPPVFGWTAGTLLLSIALSYVRPTRRALSLDPAVILRGE